MPDPGSVRLAGGFEPGRICDLVHTPAECPVVGAGLLAVRDLAAWARGSEDAPTAGRVDHAIAEGVSQCGRFLLAGDVELCVSLAGERYDAVVNLDA